MIRTAPALLAAILLSLIAPPASAEEASGVTIRTKTADYCLDIKGGASKGAPVIIYKCHGDSNQRWQLVNGQIKGSNNLCLDVKGGGTEIIAYDCHGDANQKWRFTKFGEILGLDNKCLDIQGGTLENGNAVILYPCHGGSNQKWRIVS